MAIKNRPNVSSFLSTSAKAHDTEQNLLEAQERITYLERELDNARQSLEQRVGLDKISHALVPIADIIRRPYQSRREKDARKFAELLHSIKTYGFKGSIWLQRRLSRLYGANGVKCSDSGILSSSQIWIFT